MESTQDGSEWFVKFNNGLLMQGGILPSWSGSALQTKTLLKPYKDNKYYVTANVNNGGSSGSVYSNFIDTRNQTNTSFQYRTSASEAKTGLWFAIGYGVTQE